MAPKIDLSSRSMPGQFVIQAMETRCLVDARFIEAPYLSPFLSRLIRDSENPPSRLSREPQTEPFCEPAIDGLCSTANTSTSTLPQRDCKNGPMDFRCLVRFSLYAFFMTGIFGTEWTNETSVAHHTCEYIYFIRSTDYSNSMATRELQQICDRRPLAEVAGSAVLPLASSNSFTTLD
ncbi:hypothetical protein GALMADRAFT_428339 [Galerina marginata CBS 339.88]|uniref:Uncharacterized protein n=1 Tax=Galerina marginata (strain CBS 339.88) TaxID=685588 RepID=A0A067T436_GALM3|nr:hypothetical protein GALMADRAFT_428339 [Galerina marginata CBS 339.88]